MKVIVDSHALVHYLADAEHLSEPAVDALLAAENSEGVVVSVATLGDLWYASQKTSSRPVAPGIFEYVRGTALDPSLNFVVYPISAATMIFFDDIPLNDLRDPFDRFILATAAQLRLPLVTADRAIAKTGMVEIIW
ncbi:MAG TPA: PIN domain-containing protein [Pseudonocardiaceae bacterium]|jgi:PIN domain nuclease of toxin-antitoxin system|nr:PIN domain-containing protein [Pseudonocardiaceae bacterium]